jgi:glucose/arabinose dehydrogenase
MLVASARVSQATTQARNADATALPSGYVDELVAPLGANNVPTGIRPLPDGRVLVTIKTGQLHVVQNGALSQTPLLDLSSQTCNDFERGLQSVAVDPDFATNGHIYVFYTWNGGGRSTTCTSATNRVVRYRLDGNTAVEPLVILDAIPSPQGNHNGGDMHFGADGLLYIATGDGGKQVSGSATGGANNNARNRSILLGKILRIAKDGSIPADNPFVNEAGSGVCGGKPAAPSGGVCRETYAWGLRNPFKFAFNADASAFYINDVGQGAWEEINVGAIGTDYGWNTREGRCVTGSTSNCPPPAAGETDPLHVYGRSTGCAITGGAFSDASWAGYENRYFFGDYCNNEIYLLSSESSPASHTLFHTSPGAGKLVAMHFDPATRALYYTLSESYAGDTIQQGVLRRVRYTQAANQAPNAVARSTVVHGPVPLTVQFSGDQSSDPDGDALTYNWTFGDGTTSTAPNPVYTYTVNGVFVATLVVTDARGTRSAPAVVRVYPGNTPPVLTVSVDETPFRVGQVLVASATAGDAEEGALPPGALRWQVLIQHVSVRSPSTRHTHPFFSGTGLAVTLPPLPGPEDLDAAAGSYLELRVEAADSTGLSSVVTRTLTPKRVSVQLASQPGGLSLRANELTLKSTSPVVGWHGMTLTLDAPLAQPLSGTTWAQFTTWEHGGAPQHEITLANEPITFTARYQRARAVMLPIVGR